jgi:hypothetical protein
MDPLQTKGMMVNTREYQDPLLYRLWVFLYNVIVSSNTKGEISATVYLNDVLYELYMVNEGSLEKTAKSVFDDLDMDIQEFL